jgi:hypothetical protein
MKPFEDDNDLIAELHALRPTPRPAFAAELDERAAAGFPRRSALGDLLARLRALPPRRLLLPAGATALAAIAAATVVVAVSEPSTDPASLAQLSPIDRPASPPEAQRSGSGEGAGVQYETVIPTIGGAQSETSSGSGIGGAAAGASVPSNSGPYASKTGQRDVERSAEMVLGTKPDEVADAAAKVFDAVRAADGIVLSSSVSGGAAGDAGARFELLIPSAKLGDALAAFSAIDLVVSRHEATDDITAPTVRSSERLRDSRARIDGLLVQLAGADSDGERAKVEVELGAERRHAAALRSQLTKLDRRANLSRVSLRIETSGASTSSDGGGWGIGDAFGDAGHILAIAASVTIVALAIVAPLALIALLAWLASRAWIRRGRERALE